MNISALLHININCSDFDRSRIFYEMLGFKLLMPVAPEGTDAVAAAVGMTSYKIRGALMRHPSGAIIDLLQWQQPRDDQPPYQQMNHLGLARVAFETTDIEADIAQLTAAGAQFLSVGPGAITGPNGATTRFICFKDPDGTVLELVDRGAD